MAIKAATPMKTPSIVKAERIMLRQMACTAAAMIIRPTPQTVPARRATAGIDRAGCASDKGSPGAAASSVAATLTGFGLRTSETICPSRIVKVRSV